MLFAVVQPMPCAASPDQALQLVCLDPNQLIYALVAPQVQALPAKLHGTPFSMHNTSSFMPMLQRNMLAACCCTPPLSCCLGHVDMLSYNPIIHRWFCYNQKCERKAPNSTLSSSSTDLLTVSQQKGIKQACAGVCNMLLFSVCSIR